MAFAFVQAKSTGTDGTGATTLPLTVTAIGAGNMVAGVVTWGSGTVGDLTSITDNKAGGSNTYTIVRRIADSSNGQSAAVFYGYNLAGTPTTITANFGSSQGNRGLSIIEASGELTSGDPLDGTNEQGQLQTAPGTGANGAKSGAGNKTPSQDNCLIYGGSVDTGATNAAGGSEYAAGTSFTEPANAEYSTSGHISLSSEYWIQTTATAANASFTVTQNVSHLTFMMVFKDAGGGGGGTVTTTTLSDTLAVADTGIPSAVRGRLLSDSLDVTEGPTVISTIYGLLFGDDLTLTDQLSGYPVRGRLGESTIAVTDEAVQFFRRTRLAEDFITLTDEALASLIAGLIHTRVLSSQIDVTDATVASVLRNVILQSSIVITDELIASVVGNNILTKVLSSFIDVTDGAVLSIIRGRLLQDTIIISEGATEQYTTTNLLADDEIQVDDESLTRLILRRILGDDLTITDAAIATIVGQNVIEKILSDTITTADEAIRWMNRVRFGESLVLTADEIVKVMRLTRELTDALDLFDGTATAMQRFILLTDALSVQDAATATYVPDTGPVTSNPVIRIGFDQPRIEVGGRALN